jgi:hypothetical protein
LYKGEKPAEYISARHCQNGTRRVDRILRKQKYSCQKVDEAHYCLNSRDETVSTGKPYAREGRHHHIYDREHDDETERNPALSRAYRHRRDHDRKMILI